MYVTLTISYFNNEVSSQYEQRIEELWCRENPDNFTWEEIVHNEYLKLRKSSKNIYTKLLYKTNEIYMNPDYKPGEYLIIK